ncbi:hypothetical protein JW949_03135 [Candidatus Woesearchaeota archaeon]|nr:hypothetical protein [Candidatus Woesearchaeota archaeon]
MKILDDIEKPNAKTRIQKDIKENGYMAEHNYYCYLYNNEGVEKDIYFSFDNKKGIMARHLKRNNKYYIFSDVIAPEGKQLDILYWFLDYCLYNKNAKEVEIEFSEKLIKKLKRKIQTDIKWMKFSLSEMDYGLIWPVYEMAKWKGEKMKGKEWKKIRYYWNNFFRKYDIKIKPSKKIRNEELYKIVKLWKRKRNGEDAPVYNFFLNAIKNNFRGFDMSRTMIINNEPSSITAGFRIPNSNNYYSAIGLTNYKYDRLGEIANMDDLIELKKTGYDCVDFGGSDDSLFSFKKKFRPTGYYNTYVYQIRKPRPLNKIKNKLRKK